MNGLEFGVLKNLLQAVVNKQISLRDAKDQAVIMKMKQRCEEALKLHCVEADIEGVQRELGKAAVDHIIECNFKLFNKPMKTAPPGFTQQVTQIVKGRQLLREREREAAAAQGEGSGAGAEQDFRFDKLEFYRCALAPEVYGGQALQVMEEEKIVEGPEHRGDDDEESEDEEEEGAEKKEGRVQVPDLTLFVDAEGQMQPTMVTSVHGDINDHTTFEDIKKHSNVPNPSAFTLVILDPPYGLNLGKEAWDKTPYPAEKFLMLTMNLCEMNSSNGFTMITFCAAHQISGYLEKLKTFQTTSWTCTFNHGVWVKDNAHSPPSRGSLPCHAEFLIFAWFVRKQPEGPHQKTQTSRILRSLFHHKETEKRSNVYVTPVVKAKLHTTNEKGEKVVTNMAQKPIGLLRQFIEQFSTADDTVLDLCSGSGSTTVACVLSNRHCVSIESDEFQISQNRMRLTQLSNALLNWSQVADTEFFDISMYH